MQSNKIVNGANITPGCNPPGEWNSNLRERLEKAWSTLGEALSNVRSINYKLFVQEPCDSSNKEIAGANTENIESLICLIESLTSKLESETREISGRI